MLLKCSAEHPMKNIFDSTVFSCSLYCGVCSSSWLSSDKNEIPAQHKLKRIEIIEAANENSDYVKHVVLIEC